MREADDRRGNLSRQHIEGDKLTNGEFAFNNELGTEIQCGDGYGFLDKLDTLLADGGQLGHAETGVHIAGHLLIPATGHLRLDRHGFNGAQRGHGFDEKRLIIRIAGELVIQARAQYRRNKRRPCRI